MRILAIDIGGTDIKYGICSEDFSFIEKKSTPTNARLGGQEIVNKLCEIIANYDKVDKIGISTAGQVNNKTGEIVYSTDNIPNYTGTRIKAIIESKFNIPTYVENDVNSAAIGEHIFGAGKGYDSFICLTYGTGIGGAIMINDEIFTGSSSSAGEMGHIITHHNGKACTCGGCGCYEQYASTTALINQVEAVIGEKLNGKEIFARLEDEKIKSCIDNWIDEIVLGLTSLSYVFNPALIIVGGGIMNEEYITAEINKKLPSTLMKSFRNIEVKKALNGNDSGMLGAAYMASKI